MSRAINTLIDTHSKYLVKVWRTSMYIGIPLGFLEELRYLVLAAGEGLGKLLLGIVLFFPLGGLKAVVYSGETFLILLVISIIPYLIIRGFSKN